MSSTSKKGTFSHSCLRKMTKAGVKEDFRVELDIFQGHMWNHYRKKFFLLALWCCFQGSS